MVLGISEDFTTDVQLDTELNAAASSGLNLNSGVHPSVTVSNLLEFLPNSAFVTIADWSDTKTYSDYNISHKRTDLVSKNGVIYQSLQNDNLNNDPETEDAFWLQTNIESLVLKSFVSRVQDKVYADLSLVKRLVNNQYIYEVGRYDYMLPNQFCAYVFEPKGSDYVKFTINQIAFQALTTDPVNLYVVNENVLVDTLILTPNNGVFEFKDINYTFSGPGKWFFIVDSQMVKSNQGVLDPLKYDGFVCYTASGIGSVPNDCTWSFDTTGNGLGFNISVCLDSEVYIDNNVSNFGSFIRATFELMSLQMFLHNSNNRSNRNERMQMDRELLTAETKSLEMNTVAKRYNDELKRAKRVIEKTFDTQLNLDDEFCIELNSL